MIEYTDIGVLGFVKTLFPDCTVVWSHPDMIRNRLADAKIKDSQNDPKNTVGIPGFGVFRTACHRHPASTLDQIHRGRKQENKLVNGNYNFIKTARVMAQYTIVGVAKHWSDLNYMQRKIWFIDDYSNFVTEIQGTSFNWPITRVGDPVVTYEMEKDTGKILWYHIQQDVEVSTLWTLNREVPPIETIVLKFQEIIEDGEPVDLDTLTVVPIETP